MCVIPGDFVFTLILNKLIVQKFVSCSGKPRANNEKTEILTEYYMLKIEIRLFVYVYIL